MTSPINSDFIENNNNSIQLCCNNQEAIVTESKIIDNCSGERPIEIGSNTANFNDILTDVGVNGGPSAYGCYDMMGQVDEWIFAKINSSQECYGTYAKISRFYGSDNFLKLERNNESNFHKNGVRFVSQYSTIKILNHKSLQITESGNTANHSKLANWGLSNNGNITDVGTNGRGSYYGTFDQNGLVWEWTNQINSTEKNFPELIDGQEFINIEDTLIRGGSWNDYSGCLLRDALDHRVSQPQDLSLSSFGLRLCSQTGIQQTICFVEISGYSGNNIYNTANYNNNLSWLTSEELPASITSVGTNGKSGPYGTYDQDGLVWEVVTEEDDQKYNLKIRGGSCFSPSGEIGSQSSYYLTEGMDKSQMGVRLCSVSGTNYDFSCFVKVGGSENPPIEGTCGTYIRTVKDDFYIQKYPLTNEEYTKYLNIVDPAGAYTNTYFSYAMGLPPHGGISFISSNPIGKKYTIKKDMNKKPLVGFEMSHIYRLVNWLHQGSPSVSYPNLTVSGAYNLSDPLNKAKNKANYAISILDIPKAELLEVGENGGPSFYGTYDQSGGVAEWCSSVSSEIDKWTSYDYPGFVPKAIPVLCGGSYLDQNISSKDSFIQPSLTTPVEVHKFSNKSENKFGFRLASRFNDPLNYRFNLDNNKENYFIPINSIYGLNILNKLSDHLPNGNILKAWSINSLSIYNKPYNYSILKYSITNKEYVEFLNFVDPSGLNEKKLYKDTMVIFWDGTKYSVATNDQNKPVNYINYFDTIRYCNWMHNTALVRLAENNPNTNFAPIVSYTENGAYDLNNIDINNPRKIYRNSDALYWLPSIEEWYTAAYYNANEPSSSFFGNSLTPDITPGKWMMYATNSDNKPEMSIKKKFWIPSESEWYKAAYYNRFNKTYFNYATSSNTLPSGLNITDKHGNGAIKRYVLTESGTLDFSSCSEEDKIDIVPYNFTFSKYPITNAQYVEFLNAIDPEAKNIYGLYTEAMFYRGTILFDSLRDVGSKYYINENMTNKPLTGIDWYSSARYCNWLHNKEINSTSNIIPTTEYGAYTILGKNIKEQDCKINYTINNSANIGSFSKWIYDTGTSIFVAGPTTVGTNGSASYYGTYDQNGNMAELCDGSVSSNSNYEGITSWVRVLGGSWSKDIIDNWRVVERISYDNDIGFRLSSLINPLNFSQFVTVSDVDNIDQTTDALGKVGYSFKIMKYEFTNNEYVQFLNKVDISGLASNPDYYNNLNISGLYKIEMTDNNTGGILLDNSAPTGQKYKIKSKMDNKPVNFVSWIDAARVCNWLHNGATSSSSTLSGVYYLSDGIQYQSFVKIDSAKYWIPTKDEWYKSAYYDQTKNKNNGGYWKYATRASNPLSPMLADDNGDGLNNKVLLNKNAKYWIPIEEEWYKAAFFDPSLEEICGGFWNYATQSNSIPLPLNPTDINSLGSGHYIYENCSTYNPIISSQDIQCGDSTATTITNQIDFSCFVLVDDKGNPADDTGYGGMDKKYYIQKYPLTNYEYSQFLNDVDPSGLNPFNIINPYLSNSVYEKLQSPIKYYNGLGYVAAKDAQNTPAIGLSIETCARIANWLSSKKLNINNKITESGTYKFQSETNTIISYKPDGTVRIPSIDEWYKAAFYKRPSGVSNNYIRSISDMSAAGYWKYATQNDSYPENT